MFRTFIFSLLLVLSSSFMDSIWAMTKSIAKNNVNIRVGPSLDHTVSFQVPIGYPVEIEKQQDEWIQIKDWEGDVGWVSASLVSDVQTAVVQASNANIRTSPGLQHHVKTQVHKGEIYKVLAKQGDWVKIGYFFDDIEIGWIRHDLVFGD
jgi:uncharacterized protein YgiM (DUF1202 family)